MSQEALNDVGMEIFSRRISPYFSWLESRIESGWEQSENITKDVLKETRYLATTMRARFILGVSREEFSEEVAKVVELFELAMEAFPYECDEVEAKLKHFSKGIEQEFGAEFLPKKDEIKIKQVEEKVEEVKEEIKIEKEEVKVKAEEAKEILKDKEPVEKITIKPKETKKVEKSSVKPVKKTAKKKKPKAKPKAVKKKKAQPKAKPAPVKKKEEGVGKKIMTKLSSWKKKWSIFEED